MAAALGHSRLLTYLSTVGVRTQLRATHGRSDNMHVSSRMEGRMELAHHIKLALHVLRRQKEETLSQLKSLRGTDRQTDRCMCVSGLSPRQGQAKWAWPAGISAGGILGGDPGTPLQPLEPSECQHSKTTRARADCPLLPLMRQHHNRKRH